MTKYLTIAAGAAALVLAGVLYLTYSLLQSCNTQKQALAQQIVDLEVKLTEQNARIDEWLTKAKVSQEASRKAVAASREKGKRLAGEIARLKRAAAEPRVDGPCPAGGAVKVIRESLK